MKSMSIDDGDNRASEEQNDAASRRQEAAEFKEMGNQFVKSKQYEAAVKMYSRAIDLCDNDPLFFSNRSQCYLSLEKYKECIDDASKAIALDSSFSGSKAFYRRMTAYEKLGEDVKALQSCSQWLKQLPEDQIAKNAYDRIHNRIMEAEKKKDKEKIRWSRLGRSSEVVSFVTKPPHLSSKRPMKKIPVRLRKAASPIPEAILDRIFGNNTGETVPEPETDSKLFKPNFLMTSPPTSSPPKIARLDGAKDEEPPIIENKKKINETNEILKATEIKHFTLEELEAQKSQLIAIPSSGPQFYSAWKELSEAQRFLYLKNIADHNAPIGKLLGAQLSSGMLSEIIYAVHKYFPLYNLSSIRLLHDLGQNPEVRLLSMFLETDETTSEFKSKALLDLNNIFCFLELNELLALTQSSGDNETNNMVLEVKKCFQL